MALFKDFDGPVSLSKVLQSFLLQDCALKCTGHLPFLHPLQTGNIGCCRTPLWQSFTNLNGPGGAMMSAFLRRLRVLSTMHPGSCSAIQQHLYAMVQ